MRFSFQSENYSVWYFELAYAFGHKLHWNGRISKWITECAFSELLSRKSFPHCSQTYGLAARKTDFHIFNDALEWILLFEKYLLPFGSTRMAFCLAATVSRPREENECFDIEILIEYDLLTMSSSHMIIIRWHINEKMITLCTAVHFNAGSNMHPSMNLLEYIRIFIEKTCFRKINRNSR